MGPKRDTSTCIDELVTALKDERVLEALGTLFKSKLQPFITLISELKLDNVKLTTKETQLESNLISADKKIDALEAYTRADNLIIVGLPSMNYADATSAEGSDHNSNAESSVTTEKAVLDFCQNKLDISIVTQDISIAHRLKKSTNSTEAPPVIVMFTTRKVRDAAFAARRRLKGSSPPIFINEDLTKRSADLYRRARALVRNKTITSTWTKKGSVFIKTSDNPNIKPLKIFDVNQLNDLQANLTVK